MTYNYSVQTGQTVTMKGGEKGEYGLQIDFGFDTLTIPWESVQIWDFGTGADAMNPCQLYNGEIQYVLAYSAKDIKGDNIRAFGSNARFMWNVPKEVFYDVAKLQGKEDKIATWESTAKPYVAPTSAPANTTVAEAEIPV